MSVQTEINRISTAKEAIATAIAGKGVTVPSGTKLDGMSALIENIESGGATIVTGEYNTQNTDFMTNPISITGLGFRPVFVLFRCTANISTNKTSPYYVSHVMWHEGLDVSCYANVAYQSGKTYVPQVEKSGVSVNNDGFTIKSPRSDYALFATASGLVYYEYIAIG